ncbi:hypothetical protein H2201_006120 [Coniosporium apollinis]|uniref:AAA+ ATPase domain-containing protein n=1 Tax=Coniosporium apollinis TaxID=61459 RepID=A0ABQ9NMZ7_9PEZI|nr:hypothetical protein H2201_006120 [Coniosporium apollinis]
MAIEVFLTGGADGAMKSPKNDPVKSSEHTSNGTATANGHIETDSQEKELETPQEPQLPTGSKSEIKALVQRFKDGETKIEEREAYLSSLERKPYGEFAIVTKQVFSDKDKIEKTLVEINSPQLLTALKELVKYYPAEPLQFDKEATFEDPFMLLNHYVPELQAYKQQTDDDVAKDHIDLLINFLESEAGEKGQEAKRLVASSLITFDLLWVIFKPGELMYESKHGHERLYQLQRTGYGETNERGRFFEVSCGYTNFDGVRSGRSSTSLRIWERNEFVGQSPSSITGLSVFPLRFRDQQEELKDRLVQRGKKYLDIRGVQSYDYEGLFLYLKQPPESFYNECATYEGTWLPRTAAERIVVDNKTFLEELAKQKEDVCTTCPEKNISGAEGLSYENANADPLLCPPYVYGFNLEMKEWCRFFVDSLKPFTWVPNAMDQLVLPDSQRRLIRSLVTAHRFPDQARNEATLKGKGLIMLLHGPPGSGKTLTGELVAEHTKRPLLKISTGELGSWEHRITFELKRLLTYASIWHAIVLIDEADVFLEARRSGARDQLEQNSMVAIFLRQLEYFQGILFLTSNRVEVFDPAIKSRIHLALQYNAPDGETRRQIWRQQLAKVPVEEAELDVEGCLAVVVKAEMNGREIANAVNTARTLAAAEEGKLKLEHLETVLDVWSDFQSAIEKIEKDGQSWHERK